MTVAAGVLISIGAVFMLLAAVGVVRFPDVYSRMHSATKAASLGFVCVLLGAAFLLDDGLASAKLVVAALVQLVVGPAAAHALGRAIHGSDADVWPGTRWFRLGEEGTVEEVDQR